MGAIYQVCFPENSGFIKIAASAFLLCFIACNPAKVDTSRPTTPPSAVKVDSLKKVNPINNRNAMEVASIPGDMNTWKADFSIPETSKVLDTFIYTYELTTNVLDATDFEYLINEYAINQVPPDTAHTIVKHTIQIHRLGKRFQLVLYVCRNGNSAYDIRTLDCRSKLE